jgi:hypothetical protein
MHARPSVGTEKGSLAAPARAPLTLEDVCRGMVVRTLHVAAPDVVFVKGVLEASDGVASLFAESGGELSIAAPPGRERDLAELIDDLRREIAGVTTPDASLEEPRDDG